MAKRNVPELFQKFLSVPLSMSNKQTVRFFIANLRRGDKGTGKAIAFRTVQRRRSKHRKGMVAAVHPHIFKVIAEVYGSLTDGTK